MSRRRYERRLEFSSSLWWDLLGFRSTRGEQSLAERLESVGDTVDVREHEVKSTSLTDGVAGTFVQKADNIVRMFH